MNRKNEIRPFFEEAGRKVLNRRESTKRADSRAIKDLAEDSKPKYTDWWEWHKTEVHICLSHRTLQTSFMWFRYIINQAQGILFTNPRKWPD